MSTDKTSLENETTPSCSGAVSGQLPLGEDMDGNQIFPNDIVLMAGDKNLPVKIEYGKYREKFDCGYIIGWYVPDYCKKAGL